MNGFGAMFRKELTQMMRDKTTLMFALMVPVFELILFGVIDMTAKDIPTVVFDQSRTQESRRLIEQFGATGYLEVVGNAVSRAFTALPHRADIAPLGDIGRPLPTHVQRQSAIEGLVGEEMAAAVTGQKPVAQALRDAERRVNELLAEIN